MRAMRVARRDRLVFLHIPKTAGTSMRHYLHAQYRREDIFPATNWNECVAGGLDPADYALFAGHFRFSFRAVLPPGTRSLVILRDPAARYISHLRHARAASDFDPHHDDIKDLALADIIRDPQYGPVWSNGLTKWLAAPAHPAAVARFLAHGPASDPATLDAEIAGAERLARAKCHLEEIEMVGFTEDMDRLADELCAAMNFHPPPGFPVKNVGLPGHRAEEPSREDRAIIARLNEEDVELCAYARQIAQARRRRRTIVRLTVEEQYDVPDLPFELDLNAPMPGSGWHHAEGAGGATWRWTDAETVTSLQFARAFPRGTTCTIGFFDWAVPSHPTLELAVNGAARAFSLSSREAGHELRFVLSDDQATGFYDIALRTLWPLAAKSDLDDARSLGIAVCRIAFAPDMRSGESRPMAV